MAESILLTGATGALGSTLLPILLEKGHRVTCLVRRNDDKLPRDRIFGIVGKHPRLAVIEGDVCKPRCGISSIDQDLLKGGEIASILHVAASIAFNDEELTERTNVNGVQNMLELAEVLGVHEVRHVSTAYIAGDLKEFSETDFYREQRWRNAYEQSKFVGEKMVWVWGRNPERKVSVFRPSILIGGEDGRTSTFDAYYTYLQPIHVIAEKMRDEHSKGKRIDGVKISDGWVNIPLIMRISPTSTLNLIPTNWVARTMAELVEIPFQEEEEAFHLVHPNPPKILDVLKHSLQTLKVCGVMVAEDEESYARLCASQPKTVARLQRGMCMVHKHYIPYTTAEPHFEMRAPQRVLGGRYQCPPNISEEFLQRLLLYAIDSKWGVKTSERAPT